MKKEDKELLLKDLSARLPYGVKILHEGWNYEWDDELSTVERVVGIDDKFIYTKVINNNDIEYRDDKHTISLFDDKLFLRPMSSMTKEEKKEFDDFCVIDEDAWMKKGITGFINQSIIMSDGIDWLNEHHFDYRGLIPKGLAIEAKEGMYDLI